MSSRVMAGSMNDELLGRTGWTERRPGNCIVLRSMKGLRLFSFFAFFSNVLFVVWLFPCHFFWGRRVCGERRLTECKRVARIGTDRRQG